MFLAFYNINILAFCFSFISFSNQICYQGERQIQFQHLLQKLRICLQCSLFIFFSRFEGKSYFLGQNIVQNVHFYIKQVGPTPESNSILKCILGPKIVGSKKMLVLTSPDFT